jgi:hypothetical protein
VKLGKLMPTLSLWGGMAISGLVIQGQIVPNLVLGFVVGFLTLHLSLMIAKPEAATASDNSYVLGRRGGARLLYGLILFLFACSALMFCEAWRTWAWLEGHVILASTTLYLSAVVAGVALCFAIHTPKWVSA